nr:AraC family transcriptional regulator [uncultured Acetatifactor sp.]
MCSNLPSVSIIEKRAALFNGKYLIRKGNFLMREEKTDILDNYAFHFLEDVDEPFIQLVAVGREARHSSRYHLENREREPACLLQYTLSGSGTVRIGGQEQNVDEGKAFFLKMPGEEGYYFDSERNQAPWEFLFAIFECHGAERYCRQVESRLGKVFSLPRGHEALRLLWEMHAMAKEGRARDPFLLSSLAFGLLCALCAGPSGTRDADASLSARAKDYIRRNFASPMGIADVAAYLGVSQSHLSREFYRETGGRPIDYLTKIRLDRAVDMLTAGDRSIREVGEESGFSGGNYFSKVFKRHMGMTPAAFREYVRREGYSKMQI